MISASSPMRFWANWARAACLLRLGEAAWRSSNLRSYDLTL